MKLLKLLPLVAILALAPACTQQERAKSFGGTAEVVLPQGTKLVGATWKETQLWYLTRPRREGEVAETLTFEESSNFGILEGKVIFKEQ
jgi:hypothetical protein